MSEQKQQSVADEGLARYIELNYLKPDNAVFNKTAGGILSLKYRDEEYERVHLYRSFPFSLEDDYISVRDKKGEEIGIIQSLSDFPHKKYQLLKEELEWSYFCPDIKLIYSLKEEYGYSYWDVETDKGRRQFTIRGRDQALTPVTEKRYLITDIDGNRFQISDIEQLDKKSFKLIGDLV